MKPLCSICTSSMTPSFVETLLRQYEVSFYQCPRCGLLQTEEPYWLEHAYRNPIVATDTGLVQRNILISARLAALLYFQFDPNGTYLDVAGGYGLMTRIMRDYGFDFYWSDKLTQNLFARGFEADKATEPFNALTAFEVLEHVHEPLAFVTEIMETFKSRTLVFSTELYRGVPPANDWWYYSFNNGQHISFYQPQTLKVVAERLGLRFYSAHGLHMFTDQLINIRSFSLLTGRIGLFLALIVKRKMHSMTQVDHDRLMNTDHHK